MRQRARVQEDPQRVRPAARCSLCGRELYPGESRWYSWGSTLCRECREALEQRERRKEGMAVC